MNQRASDNERLDELLADQALFGLSDEEKAELNRLSFGRAIEDQSFDQAAALASLAFLGKTEPLPGEVKRRILDSFSNQLTTASRQVPSPSITSLSSETSSAAISSDQTSDLSRNGRNVNRREMVAWLVAAASVSGIVFERLGMFQSFNRSPSMADLREDLIRSQTDLLQVDWQRTDDPSAHGVVGDVVWSTHAQQGFLRIMGLPENEPFVHQYQSWIFDKGRDDRYPIDGGTFNVVSRKEMTIVQISPRILVEDPKMFAITVEKRGGVVVSNRQRLLLVAPIT